MELREIKDRTRFDGLLLVKECTMKMAQNGRHFLDLTLADRWSSIAAKIWDWDAARMPPAAGSLIKVEGFGNDFGGKLQLKIDRFRDVVPEDGVSLADFVPTAPENPRTMLKEVLETVAAFHDDSLRNIVSELLGAACADDKLLTFPAAKQLHHAELGGLLHHITGMLRAAKALLGVYPDLNADLLLAGVIVHDLGKLRELVTDATGLASEYSVEGRLLGHIVRGAIDIERAAERVGADRAKAMQLSHLVLSHHGRLDYGSPVLPKIPEAEVLSLVDVLDARLFEMREALTSVAPGGFSAKVWALDNRELYKVPQT